MTFWEPDRVEMLGAKCIKRYCRGHYKETSLHDDIDGVVHCSSCNHEVERHPMAKGIKNGKYVLVR